jgi:hypothetical protein
MYSDRGNETTSAFARLENNKKKTAILVIGFNTPLDETPVYGPH